MRTKDPSNADRIVKSWRVRIATMERVRQLAYERKQKQGQIIDDAVRAIK